jgi:hypothetical protein
MLLSFRLRTFAFSPQTAALLRINDATLAFSDPRAPPRRDCNLASEGTMLALKHSSVTSGRDEIIINLLRSAMRSLTPSKSLSIADM